MTMDRDFPDEDMTVLRILLAAIGIVICILFGLCTCV